MFPRRDLISVIASTEFVRHVDGPWSDLGPFGVAGFAAPERVYGLPDEDTANGPLADT